MSRVVLVAHPGADEVAETVAVAAKWLTAAGHDPVMPATAALDGLGGLLGDPDDTFADAALALSFGGDGTMLRTLDLVSDNATPVIGVNLGTLGYLTEVEPDGMVVALERFFAGDFAVEERMRVQVSGPTIRTGGTATNDVVLERTPGAPTVNLGISLDGSYFTNYPADGLIVATPTGSTAYNLSVRGPIVDPRHRAMLLTPVSPHILFDRCLVIEPETEVRLEVIGRVPATVSVDGQKLGELSRGEWVSCTAAPEPARLVVFDRRDFHHILKQKFGLADRASQD